MRYYYVHKAVQFAVGVLVIVCLLSVDELCHDNQRGTAFLVYTDNYETRSWTGSRPMNVDGFQAAKSPSEQGEYLTDSEKATKEEAVTGPNGSGTVDAVTDRLIEINEVYQINSKSTHSDQSSQMTIFEESTIPHTSIDETEVHSTQAQDKQSSTESALVSASESIASESMATAQTETGTAGSETRAEAAGSEESAYPLEFDESNRKKRDASSSPSTMSENAKDEGEGSAATMATPSEVLEEVPQERTDNTIGHWQGKGLIYAIKEGDEVFLREQICIQISLTDVIGIGQSAFVSQILGEYLGIAALCILLSLLGLIVNVISVHSSVFDPKQGMTIIHNGAHIILWTLAAILQYLHRQNNEFLISNGMFAPVFATKWSVCFFVMILMTVCFLLETYFYRWLHYNLYIERSAGVYKVVEPHYNGDIYRKTTVNVHEAEEA
ncbi:hypothetical protein WR25_03289 [Diploscapter pachys]|uniref:Uncharacterized protein n=1 Tax=Diploscapter pachys TaxID=2018661 RepID=A0A2A2JQT0_9BILA|nr:hypothetical protein WR25_03289 [Diploscapter pachys]